MKILIDARLYGLENAGLGRYEINLVRELIRLDSSNSYVILLRKKYFYNLSLPANWKKVLADFRHYSLKEQLLLPYLLYREKADLVHFPHFNIPLFYFGNFIVTIHDLIMHHFSRDNTSTLPWYLFWIKRIMYKMVFGKAVKKASKIIVPSKEVKNDVLYYYPIIDKDKIVYTYEGYEAKEYSNIEPNKVLNKFNLKKPYFIYFGNVYPHKNISFLIEGIRKYNLEIGELKLILSSPRNIFFQRLKKLVADTKTEKYVKLPGFISDEDISVLLKNSVGFIYPSLLEGFGLQGLEAMVAGTLLLASDIPVFKEIYGNKAIYFDPQDHDSLLVALKKALKMGKNERLERLEQAREFVKRYSWSKMARETLEVYEESGHCL